MTTRSAEAMAKLLSFPPTALASFASLRPASLSALSLPLPSSSTSSHDNERGHGLAPPVNNPKAQQAGPGTYPARWSQRAHG